jgi:hypothetical protein
MTLTVRPKTQTLQAWRVNEREIFLAEAPRWVLNTVTTAGGMVLHRRSGLQSINNGEWLLRHPDERDLLWLTDEQFNREYEVAQWPLKTQ